MCERRLTVWGVGMGNYGCSSWVLSPPKLLVYCCEHGFMGPRGKHKAEKALWQILHKERLTPTKAAAAGGLLQLPASQPWHSETVHLSSHSAKPGSPMLISFGRAPAPGVTSVTAGHMNDFNPKLPVTRKDWPRPWVITTQWLCLSRGLQGSHQDASFSSVSNFPWLPFWDLGTQPNLVSPLWLIPRLPRHKSEPPTPTPRV